MENFFFGQQFLFAKNVAKGPAQYKFGLTYWYHLFLITENIIKVYKEDVCDFTRFLLIYLCLFCVYFFLWQSLERLRSFQLLSWNLFCTKCLKILTVLDKILSFFCTDVVAITKFYPLAYKGIGYCNNYHRFLLSIKIWFSRRSIIMLTIDYSDRCRLIKDTKQNFPK